MLVASDTPGPRTAQAPVATGSTAFEELVGQVAKRLKVDTFPIPSSTDSGAQTEAAYYLSVRASGQLTDLMSYQLPDDFPSADDVPLLLMNRLRDEIADRRPNVGAAEAATQTFFRELLNVMLGPAGKLGSVQVMDTHTNQYLFQRSSSETTARKPDFTKLPSELAAPTPFHALGFVEVKKCENAQQDFGADEKGQVLNYLRLLLHHQPLCQRADAALTNGYTVRFFTGLRRADTFSLAESPAYRFDAGELGLELMVRLLRAPLACHGFRWNVPAEISALVKDYHRLVGSNRTTLVLEVELAAGQRAVLKYSERPDHAQAELHTLTRMRRNLSGVVQLVAGSGNVLILTPVGEPVQAPWLKRHLAALVSILESVHGAGWAHGDIRCENLLRVSDELVLIDFDHALELGSLLPPGYGSSLMYPSLRLLEAAGGQEPSRYNRTDDLLALAGLATDLLAGGMPADSAAKLSWLQQCRTSAVYGPLFGCAAAADYIGMRQRLGALLLSSS